MYMVLAGDTGAMSGCPFCARLDEGLQILHSNRAAACFADGFPLSDGHLLIVPRRHVARLEELDAEEWADVFDLVHLVCRTAASRGDVDGVNVGVNSGAAAGQTVDHAHVHVIPRRLGDVPDPRGGVRAVIPNRADYWNQR